MKSLFSFRLLLVGGFLSLAFSLFVFPSVVYSQAPEPTDYVCPASTVNPLLPINPTFAAACPACIPPTPTVTPWGGTPYPTVDTSCNCGTASPVSTRTISTPVPWPTCPPGAMCPQEIKWSTPTSLPCPCNFNYKEGTSTPTVTPVIPTGTPVPSVGLWYEDKTFDWVETNSQRSSTYTAPPNNIFVAMYGLQSTVNGVLNSGGCSNGFYDARSMDNVATNQYHAWDTVTAFAYLNWVQWGIQHLPYASEAELLLAMGWTGTTRYTSVWASGSDPYTFQFGQNWTNGSCNDKTSHVEARFWYYGTMPITSTPTPIATNTPNPSFCSTISPYIDDEPVVGVDGGIGVVEGDCFVLIKGFSFNLPAVGSNPAQTIGWPNISICPKYVTLPTYTIMGVEFGLWMLTIPFVLLLAVFIIQL